MRSGQFGGAGLAHQRGDRANDNRRAEGSAADAGGLVPGPGGVHAEAGGGDRDLAAGVGEIEVIAEGIDGADGNHAGVRSGKFHAIQAVVSGRGDDESTGHAGILDGVFHERAVRATERDIDQLGPGIDCGDDALGKEVAV